MPHHYCPCGAVLASGTTLRLLKSPCLRLFISIRTMKSVTSDTSVCNACRAAYYRWKNNNPDFGEVFSRVEKELLDVDALVDSDSVNKRIVSFLISKLFSSIALGRIIQWIQIRLLMIKHHHPCKM